MVEAFTLVTAMEQTLCFAYVLQTLSQKNLFHTLNGNWSLGNSHSERVGQDAFLIFITNAVARVK